VSVENSRNSASIKMDFRRFFTSVLIWTILSFTFLPFFLILLVYRYIVGKLVPLVHRNVTAQLGSSDASFIIGNNEISCHNAVCYGFEGNMELEEVCSRFESSVICKRDGKGNLMFPELQQFVVNRCGYPFWEWDSSFNIRNHVRTLHPDPHKGTPLGPQDVLNLMQSEIVDTPYPPSRSPWEIVIISNFKDTPRLGEEWGYAGTALVLHIDHVLGK